MSKPNRSATDRDRKPANVLIFSEPPAFMASEMFAEELEADDRVPFVDPRALTLDERADLLKRIDAREVVGIRFAAVAFGDRPNKNRFRIASEEFEEVAPTFVDQMLKLTHSGGASSSVGTIIAARVRPDKEGVNELILAHEIDDKDAMAAFVNGRYKKFSIELAPSDDTRCSVCGTQMDMWGTYGFFNCEHSYENAEAVIFGGKGLGNAIVQNPAYEQAGITAAYFEQHQPQTSASRAEEAPPMAGTKDPGAGADNSPQPEAETKPVQFSQEDYNKMKARAEAAEKAAKEADKKRFDAAFNEAVKGRRVEASSAEKWQGRFEKLGADDAIEMLEEQPVNPAFSGDPTGFNPGEPGEGEQPKDEENPDAPYAAIKMLVEAGSLDSELAAKYIKARKAMPKHGRVNIGALAARLRG